MSRSMCSSQLESRSKSPPPTGMLWSIGSSHRYRLLCPSTLDRPDVALTRGHDSARLSTAARAARAAPQLTLDDVADRVGVVRGDLCRFLTTRPVRGRCGQVSAEMWAQTERRRGSVNSAAKRAVVLTHPARQPATVRAATATGVDAEVLAAASGTTAAWAGRYEPPRSVPLPRTVLTRLAADTDAPAFTCLLAAQSRDCPPLLATALVAGPYRRRGHHKAAAAAVEVSSCPTAVTRHTRDGARHRLWPAAAVARFAEDPHLSAREHAASHPNLPPGLLDILGSDRSHHVRAAVAANPSCGARLLEILADDTVPLVNTAAAANPSLNAHLVSELAQDPKSEVRAAVAARPRLPAETAAVLCQDPEPEVAAAAARQALPADAAALADHRSPVVRAAAASRSDLPAVLTAAAATDSDARVRAAAAAKPGIAPALFAALATDNDYSVRRAAISALRRRSSSPNLLG